ncbi:MAG: thiamine-phosphate kinase [Bacillota bacterium]
MKLSDIGEFGLIKKIAKETIFDSRGVIKGIGDDAAVIAPVEGSVLLVSSDMLVDGVHFIYGRITPYQLGCKAMAVNLSDIAAMGGRPRHVLVSLALPGWLPVEEIEELYWGVKKTLSRWSVNLIGGDTVRSDILTIDVMIIGEAFRERVITRSGAQPGDTLMVTGSLGGSAAGLEILMGEKLAEKVTEEDRNLLLSRHLTPEPRLEQSSLLSDMGFVTSMMDISDGLGGDIKHICESSNVGAEIYVNSLPVSPSAARVAVISGKNIFEWALAGGEDYELLFTVPAERKEQVIEAFKKAGKGNVTAIGKITDPGKGIRLLGMDKDLDLDSYKSGFKHF